MKALRPGTDDVQWIYETREEMMPSLRTSHIIPMDELEKFVMTEHKDRYLRAFWHNGIMYGFGGLMNIDRVNGHAELSCLMKEFDRKIPDMILCMAFDTLGLNMVYSETYACHPLFDDWEEWHHKERNLNHFNVQLPYRKMWKGEYWYSLYSAVYA